MKDYDDKMPDSCPENRGISGQPLCDSTNPPEGDAQAGTPGSGGEVNMDPRSRDDEGC